MLDICEIPLFSLGNLLCKHFFETNFKVYGFCNRCESPGEDVQQIQRWNCMEVSKYRIDPYNTKYTGSHDYIILILCIPAAITAGSVANRDKNGRPKKKSDPPRSRPALKE